MNSDLESLRRRSSPDCLSDLQLDRLVAGEAGEEIATWKHHTENCTGCASRLEARRDTFQAFEEKLDLPSLSAATIDRADSAGKILPGPAWRRWLMILAPAAAAVLLIVLVLLPENKKDATRIKGRPSFSVVVNRSGKQFAGESGGHYFPGDRLRFRVSTKSPVHLSIFDLEASGQASRFVPAEGRTSLDLPAGKQLLVPDTIELDRSGGKEILVGFFCPSPFEPDRAQDILTGWDRQAESLSALAGSLGPGCTAQRFVMHKQEASP